MPMTGNGCAALSKVRFPLEHLDSHSQLQGFDVDHIHELCRRAKVESQLESGAWATLVPGLNVGKYDLIMTLGIND